MRGSGAGQRRAGSRDRFRWGSGGMPIRQTNLAPPLERRAELWDATVNCLMIVENEALRNTEPGKKRN